MTPPRSTPKKRGRGVDAIKTFTKDACKAEEEIKYLSKVHPQASFLATCLEAVKMLPDYVKSIDGIIKRYTQKPTSLSPGSFLDQVRSTLPGASSENCDFFEVPHPPTASPLNPFVLNRNNAFQRPPGLPSQSVYAV